MDGTELARCVEIRDLGVILDTKLTFAAHVDATVSKARRMLGLLIRSMQQPSGLRRADIRYKPMLSVFYAHVRSVLEYGSVVWSGAALSHLKRLERVQHKFLIWLVCTSDKPCNDLGYPQLLAHFGVQSIRARFLQHDLMFLFIYLFI